MLAVVAPSARPAFTAAAASGLRVKGQPREAAAVEKVRGGLGDGGVVAEDEALGVGQRGEQRQQRALLDGVLLVLGGAVRHLRHELRHTGQHLNCRRLTPILARL